MSGRVKSAQPYVGSIWTKKSRLAVPHPFTWKTTTSLAGEICQLNLSLTTHRPSVTNYNKRIDSVPGAFTRVVNWLNF